MTSTLAFEWEGIDEQTTGEPVPPGVYNVEVESTEVRQKDEEDSFPYVNIQCRILDGDYAERRLFYNASTGPKAIGFTKAVFRSFGVDTTHNFAGTVDETGQLIDPNIVGLAAVAVVRRTFRKNPDGSREERFNVASLDGGHGEAIAAAAAPSAPSRPAARPAARPAGPARQPAAAGARPGPRRIYR